MSSLPGLKSALKSFGTITLLKNAIIHKDTNQIKTFLDKLCYNLRQIWKEAYSNNIVPQDHRAYHIYIDDICENIETLANIIINENPIYSQYLSCLISLYLYYYKGIQQTGKKSNIPDIDEHLTLCVDLHDAYIALISIK